MSRNNSVNRRIVLNSRPCGAPTAENFRLEKVTVPVPSAGEVLVGIAGGAAKCRYVVEER